MTDYTFEQYLDYDRSNLLKSEFLRGDIKAMPGGTLRHGVLTTQIGTLLANGAGHRGCIITSPDVRFYIPLCQLSAYPDMMMLCSRPEFYEGKKDVVLNPTVVAEVLSPSTERYDRDVKFPCYVTVPSVSTVLLVGQENQAIQVYRRATNWQEENYTTGTFKVEGCTIALEAVYRNTDF